MPKIKVDLSNVEDRAFTPPKPGVYPVKVKEVESGNSKSGNPQLRIQLQIVSGDFKGAILSHYVPTDPDSPGYFRMQELAKAIGNNRKKFVLDTDALAGKPLKMRVKSDTYEGEYSPKVGAILPMGEDEPDEPDDENLEDDDEPEAEAAPAKRGRRKKAEPEPEPEDDEPEDDEPEDDEDGVSDDDDEEGGEAEAEADADDYDEWSIDELKAELGERALRTAGKKSVLIGRLRKDDESDEDPFSG